MKYNDLMKEYQSKCESLEVQIVALKRVSSDYTCTTNN